MPWLIKYDFNPTICTQSLASNAFTETWEIPAFSCDKPKKHTHWQGTRGCLRCPVVALPCNSTRSLAVAIDLTMSLAGTAGSGEVELTGSQKHFWKWGLSRERRCFVVHLYTLLYLLVSFWYPPKPFCRSSKHPKSIFSAWKSCAEVALSWLKQITRTVHDISSSFLFRSEQGMQKKTYISQIESLLLWYPKWKVSFLHLAFCFQIPTQKTLTAQVPKHK